MLEGEEKVIQLLESFEDVMLITQGAGSYFDARPMHVAKRDKHCNMWFLSEEDGKVTELKNNPTALVVAQDKSNCWLSLSGKITINTNRALAKSLWQEPYWEWFPQGIDTIGLCVLEFHAERAEYWDRGGVRKAEHVFKVMKAYLTGTVPDPIIKTNESVKL